MTDRNSIFNGKKLLEARESRGLTQISLANNIKISRQQISNLEKGIKSPKTETLLRLTNVLNFPIEFFYKQDSSNNFGIIFFRSFSSATKRERVKLSWKLQWLKETVAYLDRFFQFNKVNLPDKLIEKKDFLELDFLDIEKIALQLRQYWNIGLGPISNLTGLLENNGIIISRSTSGTKAIDAFSEWESFDKKAFIHLGEDKNNYFRSRFDLAHELGHLLLHSGLDRERVTSYTLKKIEQQADYFAGAFLLPAQSLADSFFYASIDEFVRLKRKWNVSVAALIMRAHQIDIISDNTKKRLFINYSRKGWRSKGEPFDDLYTPEEPTLLSKCINILIKRNIQSVEEIVSSINLPVSDIEELVNVSKGTLTKVKNPYEVIPKLKQNTEPTIYKLPNRKK